MSALTRSCWRWLCFCSAAIQAGVPVGSKRRRSCSRTSASVRYDARTDVSGSKASWARIMPQTTRPTPTAAAAAMITIRVGIRPLVLAEVPAAVDVFRPDAGRRQDARTFGVGLVGHSLVVGVGLELVLQRGVVEKPEEELRVAGRHEH